MSLYGTLAPNNIKFPAGQVLQVVQTTTSSVTTVTSADYSTFYATNVSASITPSSTSSKVLVLVNAGYYTNTPTRTNGVNPYAQLRRNSSTALNTWGYFGFAYAEELLSYVPFNWLDSPSTTSSTTYTMYIKNGNSLTGTFTSFGGYSDGGGQMTSQMTLLEIAG